MKLEKLAPVFMIILVIAALGLIGYGLGLFTGFGQKAVDPAQTEMQKVIQADKENLADANASEDSLRRALERLSLGTDPYVKDYITKYQKHSSPQVRAAAAEAAGSFLNEGFINVIKDALQSPDEIVRLGALRGLSRQGGNENERLVIAHLNKKDLSADESFQAHLTLLKISSSTKNRLTVLNRLVQLAEKSGQPDRLIQVFLFAPNEPVLIQKAKDIFNKSPSPELIARAMQYLTAFDKPWLQQHIGQVRLHDNFKFQLVLLDVLKALCPPERKAILEKLKGMAANGDIQKGIEAFKCS